MNRAQALRKVEQILGELPPHPPMWHKSKFYDEFVQKYGHPPTRTYDVYSDDKGYVEVNGMKFLVAQRNWYGQDSANKKFVVKVNKDLAVFKQEQQEWNEKFKKFGEPYVNQYKEWRKIAEIEKQAKDKVYLAKKEELMASMGF